MRFSSRSSRYQAIGVVTEKRATYLVHLICPESRLGVSESFSRQDQGELPRGVSPIDSRRTEHEPLSRPWKGTITQTLSKNDKTALTEEVTDVTGTVNRKDNGDQCPSPSTRRPARARDARWCRGAIAQGGVLSGNPPANSCSLNASAAGSRSASRANGRRSPRRPSTNEP